MPLFSQQNHAPQIVGTSEIRLAVDTTTTSLTFVDLLTLTIYTGANTCYCFFTASGTVSTVNNAMFRLTLDGTPVRGTQFRRVSTPGHGTSLICAIPASNAQHTFVIQWSVSGGTGSILPVTDGEHHASLVIQEVTR